MGDAWNLAVGIAAIIGVVATLGSFITGCAVMFGWKPFISKQEPVPPSPLPLPLLLPLPPLHPPQVELSAFDRALIGQVITSNVFIMLRQNDLVSLLQRIEANTRQDPVQVQ